MPPERVEDRWIDVFARTFELCGVRENEAVAVLSESQSRRLNVDLAEHALLMLGARPFQVVVPTPAATAPVPIRSTGASTVLDGNPAVLQALSASTLVVDVTVEGLMHSRGLRELLRAGIRVLYVSNEHPEILERCAPDPALKPRVAAALARLKTSKRMRVTSGAGTDLTIDVEGAACAGGWGAVDAPRQMDHWPGGIVACFPRAGSVDGTVVMDVGDINLTLKRYVERRFAVSIARDYVVDIDGDGLDAELMRSYFAAWGDRDAYAISHVGWGMNPRARWDAMAMYDRGDHNGTEQRVFAGNFLWSTGANEFAGRHSLGHFDLPMRRCTVELDSVPVIVEGVLQGDLA